MILEHIPHLQIFIRHKVVKLHYAPCCFYSKVFTLATYFEVFTSKFISQLGSVFRTFFSLRKSALQPFQSLFAFTKVSGICNCFPITIGVEVVQAHINTNSFTRWLSLFYLPGMEAYQSTVIDPARGERWFCTESEAIASGWRKAPR